MKGRTTLLLVAVCVILGGFVWWSGRNKGTTADATPSTDVTVLQLNPQDVTAISIKNAGNQEVRAEQDNGTWKLTAPHPGTADADAVTRNIGYLSNLKATQVITPTSTDLTAYGLATPINVFQLSKAQTVLAELDIGTKNPDGSATYVQVKGTPRIYLVTDTVIGNVAAWITAPPVLPSTTVTPGPNAPASTAAPASP